MFEMIDTSSNKVKSAYPPKSNNSLAIKKSDKCNHYIKDITFEKPEIDKFRKTIESIGKDNNSFF